ncbi:hypothetical protein J7L06_08575 [Candidatus Bathyarchaeota archaeon]|nr:hypothetical protein [Candidatus Bathyarchaeota archaeon]
MSNVRIIVTPPGIKSAVSNTANYLKELNYEALFLNLSRDLEEGVKELAEGAPYDMILNLFIEEGLIQEPTEHFKSEVEPILKSIRGIALKKPNLEVYCYKDPSAIRESVRLATEVMIKVYKWSLTGKIDLEDWKKLAYSWLTLQNETLDREASYIARETEKVEESLCIASFNGKYIKRHLQKEGCKVDLKYAYLPYHFTPFDILLRVIRLKGFKNDEEIDERMRKLIEQHGHFIRDYVVPSRDYDEAYRRWVLNNAPWIKHKLLRRTSWM